MARSMLLVRRSHVTQVQGYHKKTAYESKKKQIECGVPWKNSSLHISAFPSEFIRHDSDRISPILLSTSLLTVVEFHSMVCEILSFYNTTTMISFHILSINILWKLSFFQRQFLKLIFFLTGIWNLNWLSMLT